MFDRIVSHERAMKAAQRLINSHFGNPDRARMSIPAKEDDDDLVITDYILQQRAREADAEKIAPERMQPAGEANDRS